MGLIIRLFFLFISAGQIQNNMCVSRLENDADKSEERISCEEGTKHHLLPPVQMCTPWLFDVSKVVLF